MCVYVYVIILKKKRTHTPLPGYPPTRLKRTMMMIIIIIINFFVFFLIPVFYFIYFVLTLRPPGYCEFIRVACLRSARFSAISLPGGDHFANTELFFFFFLRHKIVRVPVWCVL